jgi:hypothetical protein
MDKSKGNFDGLLARYFEQFLESDPVFATITAGLPSGEGKLGTLGSRFQEESERRRQAALRKLEQQSPRDLSNEQHIDRLAFRSKLIRECEDYGLN